MLKKEFSLDLGGRTMTAEFNDLAENADGSVMLKLGDTVIMATAVMSEKPKEGGDYLPLTVDFESKFYATGRILGSRYVRREGRPTDNSILSGRITDRTIRPLFNQKIRHDIQVVLTALAIGEEDPDVLGVIAASLALGVSSIPFNGPTSAVRLGKHKVDGFELYPTNTERENETYEIDLVACGKDGNINMIELGGEEAQENVVVEALKQASAEIEKINAWQAKIIAEIGKAKRVIAIPVRPATVDALFAEAIEPKLGSYIMSGQPGHDKINEIQTEWETLAKEKLTTDDEKKFIEDIFEDKVNALIHKEAIENDKRPDGRGMDDVRPLFATAGGISPVLHGTGIFYRGGTHVLSVLTLGGPGDAQIIDGASEGETKRFMHHYNFPPYSTGETGRMGGTNRRMIGHGALAEKALEPMIPNKADFPYTIRLVSEAMSSNGSTSMGSVCASTLALMDGGVPLKKPVAGIASGLMMDEKNLSVYKVLTDIQGPEDHHGDMDFKVAGTRDGVTAIQMDVKVAGIPIPVLAVAFEKAKMARLKILDVITAALPGPRDHISPNAPEILLVKINPDMIGLVIGSGGKTIKEIREKTGVDAIDIDDDGSVFITGKDGSAQKAKEIVEAMTHEYKKGERFVGEVVRLMEFGAFVKIGPDTDGLVHVSEIAPFRVDKVSDVLKIGDMVPVVVKEIDEKDRINLSIKLADANFIKRPGASTAGPAQPEKRSIDKIDEIL
ncbi:MAG: polyribonucleotide nucleotidyltransferase [bacterium]